MNRILQGIGVSAAALLMTASGMMPASAAPAFFRQGQHFDGGGMNTTPVRWRGGGGWQGDNWRRGGWHGGGWHDRGDWGGAWLAAPAFIAGAVVGGALNNDAPYYRGPAYYPRQRVVYAYSPAHVEWCSGRYRSYDATDNSFEPNHGPRQECIAPFDR